MWWYIRKLYELQNCGKYKVDAISLNVCPLNK
jgi:hypothetical protein